MKLSFLVPFLVISSAFSVSITSKEANQFLRKRRDSNIFGAEEIAAGNLGKMF